MVIDKLGNAHRYAVMGTGIGRALQFLQHNDLEELALGKHVIDGDKLFAIVQAYDTLDSANEQMESHKKYVDVQYVVSGTELVGHSLLGTQSVSKPYSDEEDFMLYADRPEFFSRFDAGTFMIFFPTDLHMPCIKTDEPGRVKKIVVKVAVE